MAARDTPTIENIPQLLKRGVASYRRVMWPATLSAVVVLATYGAARASAQRFVDAGRLLPAFAIDFAGLMVATMLALPWFRLMLDAERGETPSYPPVRGSLWVPMAVAAGYFWGGVLLGIRYMVGIPSIFILVWYGLFGFAVADGARRGLVALGTSVRLGQGRRVVVAVTAVVLAVVNIVGASPLAYGTGPAMVVLTVLLLSVTTNVSMGTGAALYEHLRHRAATRGET